MAGFTKGQEIEVEPKERKMNKFKVGDYVKSVWFDVVKPIVAIDENKDTCTIKLDDDWYNPLVLILVCNFTKGQMIEVSEYEDFKSCVFTEKFMSYFPEATTSFVTVHNKYIYAWKYARAIQPKYKAFTEPKLAWVKNGLVLVNKGSGDNWVIIGISFEDNKWMIRLQGESRKTRNELRNLFDCFALEDGAPFGELLIKE